MFTVTTQLEILETSDSWKEVKKYVKLHVKLQVGNVSSWSCCMAVKHGLHERMKLIDLFENWQNKAHR